MDHIDESPFDFIDSPKKRAFLMAYATTGVMKRACEMSDTSLATPYTRQWKEDPEFQRGMEIAREMAAEVLEQEAFRRAVEGVKKYKFHQGNVVRHPEICECGHHQNQHVEEQTEEGETIIGNCASPDCSIGCRAFIGAPYYEHEYSDTLLIFQLKGAKPEKYRERIEHSGPDGGPIQIQAVQDMSDEALFRRLHERLEQLQALRELALNRPDFTKQIPTEVGRTEVGGG